ncbi:MAG: IPT/TIG domain-containing protein, partial [Chitinophagaceae bacterium]|nr:IPT/TIG domain-containing protein [Chitinophagaceae bacterium]
MKFWLLIGGFLFSCALVAQPTITSFSPIKGPVGTLVTITGSNLSNPTNVTIGGVAAIPISNSGTSLVAMVMPGATTGVIVVNTSGGNATSANSFIVTETKAPNRQQGTKLVGSGEVGNSRQAESVAISADGNTAVIGAPNDSNSIGAVWIFIRNNGSWVQQGPKLVGTGRVGAGRQGYSVDINADGNTIIVGAESDNSGTGAAWIFTRTNGIWSQQGSKLVGSGFTSNPFQGTDVAISADGNTAVISGPWDDYSRGRFWVFTRDNGGWSQQGPELQGSGASSYAQQGQSLDISSDGNTILVGGWADGYEGAAWIFTRSGNTWSQQGPKLVGSGSVGSARQGFSTALSADGNTAAIGGWGDNNGIGAVWFFVRNNSVWTQQGTKIVGSGYVGTGYQGTSLSLSADGNIAMLGAERDLVDLGASWLFRRENGNWTQIGSKLIGTGFEGSSYQGISLQLSSDGSTAIVGGSYDNSSKGAAWIFSHVELPKIISFSPTQAAIGDTISISGEYLTSINSVSLGGTPVASFEVASSTLIKAVVGAGNTGAVKINSTTEVDSLNGFIFLPPPPVISSFSPATAKAGDYVSIIGTNLIGISSLQFGGIPAANFTSISSTSVIARLGSGATGNISITAAGGSTSVSGFIYISEIPNITSFSPTIGKSTDSVTIYGTNFTGLSSIEIGGISASFQVFSSTFARALIGNSASGNIKVTTAGGTASLSGFTFLSQPVITTISPISGFLGDNINITGNHFNNVSSVSFGGTEASAFVVLSPTFIRATLGSGSPGSVVITNNGGTTAFSGFVYNYQVPNIYSFTPSSAVARDTILINGSGFIGTTEVTLGGTTATSFQILSNTLIRAVVASGSSGLVRVTNPAGSGSLAGFTYSVSAPVIFNFSPIDGQIGSLVTITGTNLNNALSITIGGKSALPISNDGNTLVAMVMPGATTGKISVSNNIGTGISIDNFLINDSKTPDKNKAGKIAASNSLGYSQFGFSVSLSADGNTALIGGLYDNEMKGAAWIYNRINENWIQGAKLVGTDFIGTPLQGCSVALSADGKTAIVGGFKDNYEKGAAWIFVKNGNTWSQQGSKLIGAEARSAPSSNQRGSNFGESVALSADGNTAVIGGRYHLPRGGTWVFVRNGSTWVQQGPVLAGTGFSGSIIYQGSSVSISADGNTLLTGGYNDASGKGAAWIFVRNGSTWTQQGTKLVPSGEVGNPNFGCTVALNADGNTAVIGGMNDASNKGAIWIFTRTGNTWSQQGGKLVGIGFDSTSSARQGSSVSISADGKTVICGARGESSWKGTALIYKFAGGVWSQYKTKLQGTNKVVAPNEGFSVAMSGDGNTAITGGPYDGYGEGAFWIYSQNIDSSSQTTITSFSPTSARRGDTITITGTNLTGTSAITLGGTSVASFQVLSSQTILAVVGSGSTGAVSLTTAGGTAALSGFVFTGSLPLINSLTSVTCSGVNFVLTPTDGINGNVPDGTTYSWSLPSFTGTVTGGVSASGQTAIHGTLINLTSVPQTATYTVTPTSPSGQGNPFSVVVTLLPTPIINNITTVTCSGISLHLTPTDSSNGLIPINTLYSWTTPTFSTVSMTGGISGVNQPNIHGILLNNQTNTTQTATYTITPLTGSCVGTAFSLAVTVHPTPIIPFQMMINCSGTLIQLTPVITASGILPANTRYSWDIPSVSSISVTGGVSRTNQNFFSYRLFNSTNTIQSATYLITPQTTNGCTGNSFSITVTLHLKPQINPLTTGTCSGITFTLNPADGINGIVPPETKYSWSIPSATGTMTGAQSGSNLSSIFGRLFNQTQSSQTVTYQVIPSTNFCGSGSAFTVTVSVNIAPSISPMSLVTENSTPFVLNPTEPTNGIIPNATRYSWNVPSYTGSISGGQSATNQLSIAGLLFNPSVSPQTATYTITPIAPQGCVGTPFTLTVTVSPNPPPTIISFTPTSAKSGDTITITGTNLNGTSAITLGGAPVASFQVLSSTTITAVVGSGETGAVSLTTNGGLAVLFGFTFITPPPEIISFSPQNGPVGTLVTISGNHLQSFTSIKIGGVPAIPISLSGSTKLVAMVMPGATNGSVSINTSGGTVNSTDSYIVTNSKIPNIQQGNKLVGNGAIGNSYQGERVALSADGNTAIIGGSYDDGFKGAAWIYTRSGSTWTQQGNKLVGTGSSNISFQGSGVAISADGNTAIVGGYADNSNKGAAWIFTRNGNSWTQQGPKLVGTGAVGSAQQGYSVAISADGNTAIIGGWADDSNKGAVWIFTRNGSTWSQMGNKLVGSGATGISQQGFSVAISADAATVIIGGNRDNSNIGAAWVFTRFGNSWTQQGNKLIGNDVAGNPFLGASVAVSADGNTAILGGFKDSTQGAAWVFVRTGNNWTQQGSKLVATGSVGFTNQGIGVTLSADGNTAMIGDRLDTSNLGGAWIYTRSGSTWTQRGSKIAGTGAVGRPAQQGVGVAISADGNTAMIGGPGDDNTKGAAWIFTTSPSPTIISFTPTAASTGAVITITGSNLIGTSAITLGGTAVASFTVVSPNTINATVGFGSTGALSLVTPEGSASLSGFIFISTAPSVNSLSTVTCSGTSFSVSPVNGINGKIPDGTIYSWSVP